jgi:hypothetical protein
MRATLSPILPQCRAIYDLEGVMERYNAYVKLMTGGAEFLPLGQFSPMGKRQAAFLDALIAQDAENHAQNVALEVCAELSFLPDVYRVMLVVVDEPRNGWTQRHLTDAAWRFAPDADALPKTAPLTGFDRWVTVQLWTDLQPSLDYVRQETRAALYRAAWTRRRGAAVTLHAMLHQEGAAARFAGQRFNIATDELEYTRAVLEPLLPSTHYPTNFAALYGDAAARDVGYAPLGVSANAGFALALEDAQETVNALRNPVTA